MIQRISCKLPETDKIFVDSNVLIFVHSGLPSEPNDINKQKAYSKALGTLLQEGKTLYTTWLNIAEAFIVIERKSLKAYRIIIGNPNISKKAFRKIPEQREQVSREINRFYYEVAQFYSIWDATFKNKTLNRFALDYGTHPYDPADYIMAGIMEREGINDIITDDTDFFVDSRFCVYTY